MTGTVASDPDNEKFLHNEFGVNYRLGKLGVNASAYNTDWQDRNLTKSVTLVKVIQVILILSS